MKVAGNGVKEGKHDSTEEGLRAMTIKERLKIHREIEAENKRKTEEFRKGGKAA